MMKVGEETITEVTTKMKSPLKTSCEDDEIPNLDMTISESDDCKEGEEINVKNDFHSGAAMTNTTVKIEPQEIVELNEEIKIKEEPIESDCEDFEEYTQVPSDINLSVKNEYEFNPERTRRKSAQKARAIWLRLKNEATDSEENETDIEYSGSNPDLYPRAVQVFHVEPTVESFTTTNEYEEDDEVSRERQNDSYLDPKDSDFDPEDFEGNTTDAESHDNSEDDVEGLLISLDQSSARSNSEDISNIHVICLCCGVEHGTRSECQMYDNNVTSIPDSTDDNGRMLFDSESMPSALTFVNPDDWSKGVKATCPLEFLTRFGPLVAEDLMVYSLGFGSTLADVWLAIDKANNVIPLTTKNSEKSNWIRYMRPAKIASAANIMVITLDNRIYFVTIKSIEVNEELRYWQNEHLNMVRWTSLQLKRGIVRQSCGFGRVKFPTQHHYRLHLILYHNFSSNRQIHNFYCHECNVSCFGKEALVDHCYNTHGTKAWKCPICLKFITRSVDFRSHMVMCGKREDIRYPCDICGKSYKHGHYLKRHVATVHLGMREFTCEFCGLQFASVRSVRRHINAVHDGQQQHICDKCGRQFSQAGNLKVHLLTHSGVKPFQCQESNCTAGYTTKQCLQFHYTRVHKFTQDNMPEIHRIVPFTYEDHSFGNEKNNLTNDGDVEPIARKRNRRSKLSRDGDYLESDSGEWSSKNESMSKRRCKRSVTSKSTRSSRTIRPAKEKKPITGSGKSNRRKNVSPVKVVERRYRDDDVFGSLDSSTVFSRGKLENGDKPEPPEKTHVTKSPRKTNGRLKKAKRKSKRGQKLKK